MSDLHDMSLKEIVRLTREEARREALEEAAALCANASPSQPYGSGMAALPEYIGFTDGRKVCEKAIRALIDKEPRHE